MHGHLSHVPLGTIFKNRRSLYDAEVHRDIRRGICGSNTRGRGAESIVLSGGYEDDVDLGNVIYYTGQGGRDRNGIQIADQTMVGLNASLSRNVETSEPVRVIRATTDGFRYDGLFLVEDAWIGPGRLGFDVCRYRLISVEAPQRGDGRTAASGAPLSAGHIGPTTRMESLHYRLKRDGSVPDLVKKLYDYRCQICQVKIETVAGPYIEGAHLIPLARQGDDHTSNLLCLCPNHHVMLDHGAIAVQDDLSVVNREGAIVGQLGVAPDHGLNFEYLALHRTMMGFER